MNRDLRAGSSTLGMWHEMQLSFEIDRTNPPETNRLPCDATSLRRQIGSLPLLMTAQAFRFIVSSHRVECAVRIVTRGASEPVFGGSVAAAEKKSRALRTSELWVARLNRAIGRMALHTRFQSLSRRRLGPKRNCHLRKAKFRRLTMALPGSVTALAADAMVLAFGAFCP